jgi:hypothetical protein
MVVRELPAVEKAVNPMSYPLAVEVAVVAAEAAEAVAVEVEGEARATLDPDRC